MPKLRQRVCLEAGLKLDLNKLFRQGHIVPGTWSAFRIVWTNNYTGEETAVALITSNMGSQHEKRVRIQIDDTDQTIYLVPKARRFGGYNGISFAR